MSGEPALIAAEVAPNAPLLLDACAVLSWLDPDGQEAAGGRAGIDAVFATVDLTAVSITVPTVVEVTTVLTRKFGLQASARDLADDLRNAGIHVVAFGLEQAAHVLPVLAAEERTRQAELEVGRRVGRLSLGDRLVMASARSRDDTLVTTDQFTIQVSRQVVLKTHDYRSGRAVQETVEPPAPGSPLSSGPDTPS